MKRRSFLKSFGALSATAYIPSSLTIGSLISNAAQAAPVDYAAINYTAPAVLPQVINIFLYGGPSELAGNLTNIADIEVSSQNSYAQRFGGRILTTDTDGTGLNGLITRNGFWRADNNNQGGAGGEFMEAMLAAGQMSVYRTIFKEKNSTRSHRDSIFLSQKGSLDVEGTPGIGTRLAVALNNNSAAILGTSRLADNTVMANLGSLESLILPFVSFEGETSLFTLDPDVVNFPLNLRGLTLDENFNNPYTRAGNTFARNVYMDSLVSKVMTQAQQLRFSKANNSFNLRQQMESSIQGLANATNPTVTPLPVGVVYTASTFGRRVRAAVTLAIHNPGSLYITVGGGLGGWDDHNNGVDRYPARMADVMINLRAAMNHITAYHNALQIGVGGTNPRTRATNNIAINMFGDFGRLVNLNGSNGWDHGNNQNLYTFGGAAVRPVGALGKVVGRTVRQGPSGQNNQVTIPDQNSYKAEPMSIAASVYSYFGVNNPEVLTRDPVLNPQGDVAINETVAGEPTLF